MTNPERMPWHLNGRQVAEWLGVSTKTVSQRDYPRTGKIGSEVLYDIREVIRVEAVKGLSLSEDGEEIDHPAEQARLTKARRIAQEIENEREQGRLRPVAEVEVAITEALSPVAAALDSLPMAIKRSCPELSQTAIEMVEREIATMRNALADDHITDSGESGTGEDTASSVSADGGGMG